MMRTTLHVESEHERWRRLTSRRVILSFILVQLIWIGAAESSSSSSSSSHSLDHLGKFSRVVAPKDSAPSPVQTFPDTDGAPRNSLVDHHHSRSDRENWLQRALAHRRLWKPSQLFASPSLRRSQDSKKQSMPQQQQYQHWEVSESQEEDLKSNRNSSSQPEIRQSSFQSISSSLPTYEPAEITGECSPLSTLNPSPSPPWLTSIFAAVSPWLNGRGMITGIQVGLIALLLRAVWKAAQEVLEEYNAELNGMGETSPSSAAGGALKPDLVERIVQAVELLQEQQQQQPVRRESILNGNEGRRSHPPDAPKPLLSLLPSTLLPWVQLAQNLIAAGLPLRSSHNGQASSVESILLSATRTELALLQQCLWTPSSSLTRTLRNNFELLSPSSPFSQIAGLDSVKQRLLDFIQLLQQRQRTTEDHYLSSTLEDYSHLLFPSESYASSTTSSSSATSASGPIRAGILLYGPPGCGKTLLVKALASTAYMPCLVVSPSTLLRKFVGDSNQQVRALFTLASKLGNCIICIDELDGLFRQRHDQEHDVTRDLKTEFLQWWDGMMVTMQKSTSTQNSHMFGGMNRRPLLVVVGATNRPFDVDPAVLRRLPQSHFVGLPSTSDRLELLHQLIYRNRKVQASPRHRGNNVVPPSNENQHQDLDLVELAMATQGYTPSDIQQLLQTAVTMGPLRRTQTAASFSQSSGRESQRAMISSQLTTQDVLNAMAHVRPTPLNSSYQRALEKFVQGNHPSSSESEASTIRTPEQSATVSKWETTWGNFYHVGTLEIDASSWNALQQILFQYDNGDDEGFNQGHAPVHDEQYPSQNGRDHGADNDEEDDDDEDVDDF